MEALPTLVSNFTIMMINMLNTSAMAGAVGAGGLGAVALTYGYQRFDYLIMYFIVIILIFLVMLIQGIGNKLYKLLNIFIKRRIKNEKKIIRSVACSGNGRHISSGMWK